MFNLEAEIEKWRKEMAGVGLGAPAILGELEDHLRHDFAREVASGTSEPEAFKKAILRIGQPSVLKAEYELVASPSILHALRRHWLKLALGLTVGLAAALVLHRFHPPAYHSETKLLFRYIISNHDASNQKKSNMAVSDSSERQELLEEQVQLLTSAELTRRVVATIGPERILAHTGRGNDFDQASALVESGLSVRLFPRSTVITVSFRHPNSDLVHPILREVVDQFLRMHVEAHRAGEQRQEAVIKVSNISLVQAPSLPRIDLASSIRMFAAVIGLGLFCGLLWIAGIRLNEAIATRRGLG